MEDAIKFENWSFLEIYYSFYSEEKRKWLKAKAKAAKDRASKTRTGIKKSRVYQLSRRFPMFQEDSIPSVNMNDVISW